MPLTAMLALLNMQIFEHVSFLPVSIALLSNVNRKKMYTNNLTCFKAKYKTVLYALVYSNGMVQGRAVLGRVLLCKGCYDTHGTFYSVKKF